jgi:hypothetical protein
MAYICNEIKDEEINNIDIEDEIVCCNEDTLESSKLNNGRPIIMRLAWNMGEKWTFKMPCIQRLFSRYIVNSNGWADPFAGFNSPAEYTNDLNPESPAKSHKDAFDYVDDLPNSLNGVIWDPPYSIHQVKTSYDGFGLKSRLFEDKTGSFVSVKNKLAKRVKIGGYIISFGWNHCGFGLKRGCEKVEILDIEHGGGHNCTMVTVEVKVREVE